MKILGIIPARFGSTRFPGKPLFLIEGKPLIQHVVERCQKSKSLSEVIVATDDTRIWEVAQNFCRVEMTSPDHPSGSDRIAEVAARSPCDAVVNIQGDEPLIDPAVVDAVAEALGSHGMSTAATPLREEADWANPNVVKVVVNAAGRALYFSRRTIPYVRDAASRSVAEQLAAFPFLKHLGIEPAAAAFPGDTRKCPNASKKERPPTALQQNDWRHLGHTESYAARNIKPARPR